MCMNLTPSPTFFPWGPAEAQEVSGAQEAARRQGADGASGHDHGLPGLRPPLESV